MDVNGFRQMKTAGLTEDHTSSNSKRIQRNSTKDRNHISWGLIAVTTNSNIDAPYNAKRKLQHKQDINVTQYFMQNFRIKYILGRALTVDRY